MPRRDSSPSITELQERIFALEGFRVSFERLGARTDALPPYVHAVMAPNGWRVSDWRRIRLAPYIAHFRGVTIYRGDGNPLARDVKLAHLRDTYYEAEYGSLSADVAENVIPIDRARSGRRGRA
ncbi:MAG: hypothetical protein ABR508_12125 [Candidatus Baltobacteraceae bacterium]